MLKIFAYWINAHAWTCVIVDCRSLSEVPGRLRVVRDVKKCVCEVSLNFEFELNTLGVFSIATYKNLNAWDEYAVGLHLGNCSRAYIDVNFFLLLLVWETPGICPSTLYTLYVSEITFSYIFDFRSLREAGISAIFLWYVVCLYSNLKFFCLIVAVDSLYAKDTYIAVCSSKCTIDLQVRVETNAIHDWSSEDLNVPLKLPGLKLTY